MSIIFKTSTETMEMAACRAYVAWQDEVGLKDAAPWTTADKKTKDLWRAITKAVACVLLERQGGITEIRKAD